MGGSDNYSEYYVFKLTETKGIWDPPGIIMGYSLMANLNSLLSVTILPTTYSLLLNVSGELIFKLFYPFVFSLVPLALYRLYERQTGKSVALLSVLFFMSSPVIFYGLEPVSLSRQIIGEFFFVLSIFLLLDKDIAESKKTILFMVFSAALVISHYSVAYIYVFYLVSIYLFYPISASVFWQKRGIKRTRNVVLVLFVVILTFSWFMYVSDSPLNQVINSFQRMYNLFIVDMFSAESRFSPVFSSLSPFKSSPIVGLIHKILIYTQQFFIFLGAVWVIVKPRKFSFNSEFRLMLVLSIFILSLCMIIPNFAPIINFTRLYHMAMLFLAPLFVLGGKVIFDWVEKARMSSFHELNNSSYRNLALRLVCIVLIASFLFETGFVNHVTEAYPYSYSLDFNRKKTSSNLGVRINFFIAYIPEQDFFSARWLSENVDERSYVYADQAAIYGVLSCTHVLLDRNRIRFISNAVIPEHGAYIYLKYLNVREGMIFTVGGVFNTSEISSFLNESNHIYSNGDSDIYCGR